MSATAVELRHQREIEHFDKVYREESLHDPLMLTPADEQRYARPPKNTIFSKEYCYYLAGDLRGKRVLEIACGNGTDTSLLALKGAHVCAYDISPEAVALTKKRAEANGLGDRVDAQVCGDFNEAFKGQTFDIIIGFAALHHLPLEGLGEQLLTRLKPGGVAVFQEPVVNSKWLDRVRRMIPYRVVEITEDEEPMNDVSIAELAKPFASIERREFECVSRIYPMIPFRWGRRLLFRLDRALMKLPFLRSFASVVCFGLKKA